MKLLPLAAAALIALPAFAQPASPPPSQQQSRAGSPGERGPMFAKMSPEGRTALFAAMRSTAEERAATKAARDHIDSLTAADTLDSAALKRAMDDERKLMDSQRARRQATMLAAIEKLSTADRKAFVESTSRARARVEARTNDWRNRSMQNQTRKNMAPKAAPKS